MIERGTSKIAVSYLRVSTTKQMNAGADVDAEGNSIATQREANNAKAAAIRAVIQKEFVEPGASAQTISKRRKFKELLAYLAEHPEVDYVIIYMRSRAFRNLGDAVVTKRQLEGMSVKLVSAKEDFGEGIMADAMEAVTDIINEVQVRMSGEDIKVKMRHKAENGGTLGVARIGYKNVRIEHEGRQVNTIAVDETRAPLIRTAFELYASGDYTLSALYDKMESLGLKTRPTRRWKSQPLSISKLHRMLRDPYYVGVVTYKGEQYPGRHEPIIDQDLFDAVQRVMDHRSTNGQRDRVLYHYLKGLLFCDRCSTKERPVRVIYVEANGRGGRYGYFLCRGRQDRQCDLPYLPAADVEHAVAKHYATVGLPEDFVTYIREGMDAAVADSQRVKRELHDGYRKQLAALSTKEERLLDLATDGELPTAKIKERLRKVQIDKAAVERSLAQTVVDLDRAARYIRQYMELFEQPQELYTKADEATRRDLNTASFERLYIDEDGVRRDVKTPLLDELHEAAAAQQRQTARRRTPAGVLARSATTNVAPSPGAESDRQTVTHLLADLFGAGSSKGVMVPSTGVEPAP
ncbi:recombinase family protein [Barrientosiimonas humi]|uniref:recombinase family protein n=1 Tax=Barrientosiimonas humi TaxID=999931 RepID=UPI00114F385B|nr:recombinase family protein [Barrientosiimonas humi]